MKPKDQTIYLEMARHQVTEHPFVRGHDISNAVLGSAIFAFALKHDLLDGPELSHIERLTRQPFLWRFLREPLSEAGTLIHGRYIGSVLNSMWSDPIAGISSVSIWSNEEDQLARVRVQEPGKSAVSFDALPPLEFLGEIRNAAIDICGNIVLNGRSVSGARPAGVEIVGTTSLICDDLRIVPDAISIEGSAWIEADTSTPPQNLRVHLREGSKIGIGGGISATYPWNRIVSTLAAPYRLAENDVLIELLEECALRLPPGPIWLNQGLTIHPTEKRWRWALRRYPEHFPMLIRLMIKHGLAAENLTEVGGREGTVQIRIETTWREILECLQEGSGCSNSKLVSLLLDARRLIN